MLVDVAVWYVIISVVVVVVHQGTHDGASWPESAKWGFGWFIHFGFAAREVVCMFAAFFKEQLRK